MAITFDAANKRIVLDSTAVSAYEIFSRWEDWLLLSDNAKYLPAFRHLGGDALGGGLYAPNYVFLLNGWRVRPMESNHKVVISGNLFVDGGGDPVVNTLGSYNVSVQYTVPERAQGIETSGGGGSGGLTVEQAQMLLELWQKEGFDALNKATFTKTAITIGDPLAPVTTIAISGNGKTLTTLERQ